MEIDKREWHAFVTSWHFYTSLSSTLQPDSKGQYSGSGGRSDGMRNGKNLSRVR